jgi:hypothetical protein
VANAERLLDVLTFLEVHPDRHDQNYWVLRRACGTVACLAGWAALRNGYVESYSSEDPSYFRGVYRSDDPHQELRAIRNVAEEVLDLTPEEGDLLFDYCNGIQDLWRIVNEITDGEVGRLRARDAVTT